MTFRSKFKQHKNSCPAYGNYQPPYEECNCGADDEDKPKKELINYDRTWRDVICLNPDHATIQFGTNEIGTITCPMCNSPMVTVVKSVVNTNELAR